STWFIAVAEFGPGSVLLIFAMGCLWSLLLPHVRRPWLPLAAVGLISLPAYFAYLDQRLFSLQLFALLTAAFPLIFGLLLGRTIARLAVRAILPPRLRSSLAGLWTIDGLAPPPGARLNA